MEWKLLQYLPITLTVTWLTLSNGPGFSEGLVCYTCHSNISWDACHKEVNRFNCPQDSQVCVKEHEIRHGQQQRFTKFCAKAGACTDHHCKEEGRKCTVDCCHQNLCNEASTIATSRTTLVFFVLLVNVIYKFCLF